MESGQFGLEARQRVDRLDLVGDGGNCHGLVGGVVSHANHAELGVVHVMLVKVGERCLLRDDEGSW